LNDLSPTCLPPTSDARRKAGVPSVATTFVNKATSTCRRRRIAKEFPLILRWGRSDPPPTGSPTDLRPELAAGSLA
jgi:hypothetical protein